jgi:flagellar basal body-associated protein FliL
MKKKTIILILIVAYVLIFGVNTTYSMYNSKSNTEVKLDFAKIIFNNEETNSFSLPISNLIPGESLEYKFKVSNNKDGNRSEINIGYSITIETFKILPATIELYNTDTEKLILTCNEDLFERNAENKLICNTEEFKLDFNSDKTDNYKIQISFEEHNDNNDIWTEEYSELIDFIDIKINSWQIVE